MYYNFIYIVMNIIHILYKHYLIKIFEFQIQIGIELYLYVKYLYLTKIFFIGFSTEPKWTLDSYIGHPPIKMMNNHSDTDRNQSSDKRF